MDDYSLADLLNTPHPVTDPDGKTWMLRQPVLLECAEYQRHMEAEALAAVSRATELPEEERRQLMTDVVADIAAKRYRYGGVACVKSLQTVDGIAKMMSIICRDQGMTLEVATQLSNYRLAECVAKMKAAEAVESGDPNQLAALPTMLASLGLPLNFLDSFLSDLRTPRSEAPKTSPPSSASPSTS